MAGHHAKRTVPCPLAIFESPRKASCLPNPSASPARAWQGSLSSENPCAADSMYLCSSVPFEAWRGYVTFATAQIKAGQDDEKMANLEQVKVLCTPRQA